MPIVKEPNGDVDEKLQKVTLSGLLKNKGIWLDPKVTFEKTAELENTKEMSGGIPRPDLNLYSNSKRG